MKKQRLWLIAGSLLLGSGIASAQSFSDEAPAAAPVSGIQLEASVPAVSDVEISKALQDEKQELQKLQEKLLDEVFIPGGGLDALERPTTDGSKRGGMAVIEVNEDGRSRRAEKIFLYYENFRMSGYLSNSASCDMRFIVLTSLDSKLVSLDVKLVWPEMTTALSFSNVMPNTPTYLDYTLMGNGCYNMDQMPNIVVNRCRVRGMNSAECADKIVWLSANKAK